MAAKTAVKRALVVDPFCYRQFDAAAGRSDALGCAREFFDAKINELYEAAGGEAALVGGYAPFCKHVFVRNFVGAHLQAGAVRITPENEGLLRSSYEARTAEELPVLTRFFRRRDVATSGAEWLDVILYSNAQIVEENEAMGGKCEYDAPWGIVSVKPQSGDSEQPMQPITMMRNALGKEEGGSGVALDREQYAASVKFWTAHATVVDDDGQ